ncbi:MAG: hypothetical protein KF688_08285 [Pirellulales bacterium]|nr:hypothetical protein [Pirellulales bacterium]
MSERERWIVYPLLFFALGAAIRDKLLHQVETKTLACTEVQAKSIACQQLHVVDSQGRILAELASATIPGGDAGAPSRQVGRLVLTDSSGQEFFGLADDYLQMRNVRCEGLMVTDPTDSRQVVAGIGSVQVSLKDRPQESFVQGFLSLNGLQYAYLTGAPVGSVPQRPRPQSPAAATTPERPGEPTPATDSADK